MAKGIIVVDIPERCLDCDFCREINEGIEACCEISIDPDDEECLRMIEDYCQSKPNWCPIKPIPKRLKYADYKCERSFVEGFNICLEEIEGR